MNTANKITILRILLVPVFMAFMLKTGLVYNIIALTIFVIASATDGVDGYIARHYNQITTFGKFVDPLADKLLVSAAFTVLLFYGRMSPWAFVIVLAREFMVSGVRLVASAEGKVIAASIWGKLKTVSQMIAVVAAIILMNNFSFCPEKTAVMITNILIWISTALTVFSGVDYLIKNWDLLEMK